MEWSVQLDGSEDPPVVVNDCSADLASRQLGQASDRFSTFIFDVIAEFWAGAFATGWQLEAKDGWPTALEAAELRRRFAEGPNTVLPTSEIQRFFNSDGVLHVRTLRRSPSEAGTSATWSIDARTEQSLRRIAEVLWPIQNLSTTLRAK